MTPKEKAEELYDKMYGKTPVRDLIIQIEEDKQYAKQCALVAVDEILDSSPLEPNFADWDDCGGEFRYWYDAQKTQAFNFWQEVKKEIQNL